MEVLLIFTDPPIVTVSPKVVTVREGDTASFNCSASSIVDTVITWYNETDPSTLTSNNGVFVITNVTRSDTGAYYCEAVDSEGIWTVQGEPVQLFVECMSKFLYIIVQIGCLVLIVNNRWPNCLCWYIPKG